MRVLIFEPNNYHFEILPGFCKLFENMGNEVWVLKHAHSFLGNEFCLYKGIVNVYEFDNDPFEALESYLSRFNFDVIFVSSFDYGLDGTLIKISDRMSDICGDIPFFGCYHDFRNIDRNNDTQMLERSQIVTLTKYNPDCICVNPCYFADIKTKKSKNSKTTYVSVGTSNNQKEIEFALRSLPLDSFRLFFVGNVQYLKKTYIKRLLFYPICKLLNIQPYAHDWYKPIKHCVLRNITYLGKTPFEKMYEIVKEADFIVLNLNNTDKDFPLNCTSGAKQLSLGFLTPCIVKREVANRYGFSDRNAVIFDDKLEDGLKKASEMSKESYDKMCFELLLLRKSIMQDSMDGISRIMTRISRES